MSSEPKVLILMGSKSDQPVMEKAVKILSDFGVGSEMTVASAHRSPARAMKLTEEAAARGIKVIIAGAGLAAHLAGVVAAHTALPVIGVPLAAGTLGGFDSLLSTVQMPPGIPVATVAIGDVGAQNAAHLAVRILALQDSALAGKLADYRQSLAAGVEKAAAEMDASRK